MSAPDELIAGRYRRQDLVGSGGMGTVWEAWDQLLDRRVAVKQLHSPAGLTQGEAELANQRAMREARITARLSHRYAVPVFDVVEHEGRPCIVMPFIPSATLSAVLREGGPLDVDEAAGVGAQVAAALAAAHTAGVVHRDVKPGNILIADDGAALISDFGISHALGDVTLTGTGEVHGTPAYLSPEVARGGEATAASDVFSLGSTLYAAVEGTPPFGTDNSIALLHKVAAGQFPPPQQAGELAPLLLAMLAPDPADRPSMGVVATRLKTLSGESAALPATATPGQAPSSAPASGATMAGADPPASVVPGRSRRRPARALAAVVALVIAGILAGLLWVQNGGPGGLVARDGSLDTQKSDPSATGTPGPGSSPTSTPSPTSPTSPAPGASGSASAAPSATTRPPTTRPPTTPPTAPRTTTSPRPPRKTTPPRTRAPGSPSAGELEQAIRSYYALMPSGTNQGWSRLTASYQRGEATSRSYYERFWGQFSRVTVSNVDGQPPDRAYVTLRYYYKNSSRVDTERRAFRLVQEDGQLKISSSYVTSGS